MYIKCIILGGMKNKMSRKSKLSLIIVLSVLAVIGLIYVGGLIFFSSHFLPNTYIDNIDVSNMNLESANLALKDLDPVLKLVEKDKSGDGNHEENISLRDLDGSISYDCKDVLKKQPMFAWIVSFFKEYRYDCSMISGSYDENKLDQLIKNLYCSKSENIVEPVDAHLSLQNSDVVLQKADDGSLIKENVLFETLKKTIDEMLVGRENRTLDLNEYYEKASIREDDPIFESAMEIVKNKISKTVSVKVDDSNTISLSGQSLCNLLDIKDNSLMVNDDAINDFIGSLCKKYEANSSAYIDKPVLKKTLSEALLADSDESMKLLWVNEHKKGLVEVIISEQMMYYYEDDVLLLSAPVVTGNEKITEATPTGRFMVRRKNQNSTLMGPDYVEHVDYWIGFDETGRIYGLHDAPWRDAYGGDIYLSDPSRGCVNMPVEKISILFDYVDYDTEVYVHE